MEPFDLNTLVEYGFPNPDYFNFDDGSLTYASYGGKNYSAGEFGGTITGTPGDPPPVDAYDQEFYEHDLVAQTSFVIAVRDERGEALLQVQALVQVREH